MQLWPLQRDSTYRIKQVVMLCHSHIKINKEIELELDDRKDRSSLFLKQ